MQIGEKHEGRTHKGLTQKNQQVNKRTINYNRFQSEMRVVGEAGIPSTAAASGRAQVIKMSRLFEAVNNERINPWEINTFSIQEVIEGPNHQEETFPEGYLRRPLDSAQNSSPTYQHNTEASSLIQKGKCRNLLKFVIKLLRDYIETLRHCFGEENSESFVQIQRYLGKLFQWQREQPSKHNINQTHLRWLMEEVDGQSKLRSARVRLALTKILRRRMGKLALQNRRCRSKLIYMNTLKVYQLRCCNSITAMRFQSSE